MTRDDIIRMAREAGVRLASQSDTIDPRNVYAHELERFAALVAAANKPRLITSEPWGWLIPPHGELRRNPTISATWASTTVAGNQPYPLYLGNPEAIDE